MEALRKPLAPSTVAASPVATLGDAGELEPEPFEKMIFRRWMKKTNYPR